MNIVFLLLNLTKYHCSIKACLQISRNFILANRHKLNLDQSFKANARRANLALQTTVIAAFFGFVMLVLDSYYLYYSSAITDLAVIVSAIGSFYLILKGHFNIAKMILFFTVLVAITINSSKDGFYAGNQYLWFSTLVGVFALFSFKQKKMLVICLLFLIGSLIFSDITSFSLMKQKPVSPEFTNVNHHVVLYLSIVVCTFFMVFIAKSINHSFHDKDKYNAIIQKQKADIIDAHRQLDKFVYHASHDLRAPLTSMLGLIEVSKRENNMDKIHNLLSKQEETILKLDDYVKDILVLSRIKTTEINTSAINIKDNIDGILKQCQFMLSEKSIIVSVDLDVKIPFFTDSKRLNVILSNIVSNSIKYTDPSKEKNTIDISAKLNKGKSLTLTITDNGVGIDTNELEKVFEMFYFNKHENKGTGLGLYIVKETVTRLGGTVTITSEKGLFTKVEIILPNLVA